MADVTVPRLGWSMEEGTLVEWFKRDGEAVRVGDALYALEGDKATETVEALDAGVLRIAAQAGARVKVGQVVAEITGAEEASRGRQPPVEAPPAVPPPPEGARVRRVTPGTHVPGSPRVTPRARRIARELGIDPGTLRGSGARGRVRERDIRSAAGASAGGRLVPLSGARQSIAARMVAGVTQAAPVTLTVRADATNLVSFRAQFQTAGGPAPSVNALLLCLTARVLRRHPRLQAQWHTDGLYYPEGVHLAFGVDTDAGLFAPVIRDANRRPLAEIARESRRLIESARAGNLSPEEMRGATFTVTNLGMFGIEAFTPIITLPQCAVLGVGRIGREAMVIEDRVVPRDALTLSLTFDHRAVDGAPAARFLDGVRKAIEAPAPWLLE